MNKRGAYILTALKQSDAPLTASSLAERLSVSRQIIVSDVAILRASGEDIIATPKGYILGTPAEDFPFTGMIVCRHSQEQLADELYTIVDLGGTVIDVTIEHAIYGELSGTLDLASRYDVDVFLAKVQEEESAMPISTLTGGIHLHRIGCKDRLCFDRIRARLMELGIAESDNRGDRSE